MGYDGRVRGGGVIAFEGLNGVGKSLLVEMVAAELGYPMVSTPPPEAGQSRRAFDDAPFSQAALLFYLSWVKRLGDAVAGDPGGAVVLCDRYIASTVGYFTAAGQATGPLLGLVEIPPPVLTVLVTAEEAVRQERLRARARRRRIDLATDDARFRRIVLDACRAHRPLIEVDTSRTPPERVALRTAERIRTFLSGQGDGRA